MTDVTFDVVELEGPHENLDKINFIELPSVQKVTKHNLIALTRIGLPAKKTKTWHICDWYPAPFCLAGDY